MCLPGLFIHDSCSIVNHRFSIPRWSLDHAFMTLNQSNSDRISTIDWPSIDLTYPLSILEVAHRSALPTWDFMGGSWDRHPLRLVYEGGASRPFVNRFGKPHDGFSGLYPPPLVTPPPFCKPPYCAVLYSTGQYCTVNCKVQKKCSFVKHHASSFFHCSLRTPFKPMSTHRY